MYQSALQKAKVLKQQGNSFFNQKNYAKAIQNYTLSINTVPLVQVYSNRAMSFINLQRYQQGLEDCESALKLDSAHFKTIIRKAKCLIYLLRIEQGIAFLQGALKEERKQGAKDVIQLANKIKTSIKNYQVHRKRKEYVEARAALSQFSPNIKSNVAVIISLIQCQARIDKVEAMRLLKSIDRAIDQTCSTYWYLRAIVQLSFGDKERAKSYLKQALRYFATKPLKQTEKNLLIEFTKQYLTELLENVSVSQSLIKEANGLMRQGKSKQVIRKLNMVIDVDAISSEQRIALIQMRAKCFKLTRQKPKQLNDLNLLLKMRPNHLQTLQVRIQFYEIEKRYELALRDAEKLNKITNKHSHKIQRFSRLIKSQQKLSYYEILDIERTASVEEVKKAYKQLAIIYHPDKNRSLNEQEQQFAKQKFKQIKKAQLCLIDPYKRQFYDNHDCEPEEFDEGNLNKNDGFDIFGSGFGGFGGGFGGFDSFFSNFQPGGSAGASNGRSNFSSFFPGFNFSSTSSSFRG